MRLVLLCEEADKAAVCCQEESVCFAHRPTLVTELPVAQQALALLNARVLLPVIQILQLVDVVLALRLSLLHIDVRQNTLDDGDLNKQGSKLLTSATFKIDNLNWFLCLTNWSLCL